MALGSSRRAGGVAIDLPLLGIYGKLPGDWSFTHGSTGRVAMAYSILARTEAATDTTDVFIEFPREPVSEAMMERPFAVDAINPK